MLWNSLECLSIIEKIIFGSTIHFFSYILIKYIMLPTYTLIYLEIIFFANEIH